MARDSGDPSSSAMAMLALWTSCAVFCAMEKIENVKLKITSPSRK